MTKTDQMIVQEFARRVRERFPSAEVYAFGSRVSETATAESDLDVCVVVSDLNDATDREIMSFAWEVGFEHDVVISTVTFSIDEFTRGPLTESPLVRAIRRDGVAA